MINSSQRGQDNYVFDRSLPSSWVQDDDEDCEDVLFLHLDDRQRPLTSSPSK